MEDKNTLTPRMVFMALVMLMFVWIGVFVILPAVTGKPGIAQKMQSDLQQTSEPVEPASPQP